jgi:hypothetical protein
MAFLSDFDCAAFMVDLLQNQLLRSPLGVTVARVEPVEMPPSTSSVWPVT